MRRILLAALLLLLTVSATDAGPLGRGGAERFGPLRLKIYGFVGDKPADVAPLTTWTLDAARKKYNFVCDKMEVLNGDASYMDVVNALEPYKPYAFRLNGSAETLRAFTSSPPKQHIVMQGVLRFGGAARIFMLESVAPTDATPVP